MSKMVLSLAFSVLSASAQLSTAVHELGDGRSQVTITSTSGVPLEAFVATWITPEPSGGHRTASIYTILSFNSVLKEYLPAHQLRLWLVAPIHKSKCKLEYFKMVPLTAIPNGLRVFASIESIICRPLMHFLTSCTLRLQLHLK